MEFIVTEVVDSGSTISHNFNSDINEMECVVSDVVDGDSIVISDNLNNPIDFSSLDFLQQNEEVVIVNIPFDNPDNIITPTCNNDSVEEHPAKKCRIIAAKNLSDQAEKMIGRSNTKLGDLNKGDNVLVTVSEFDRGRGDPPNIIGVVIEEKEGKYKVGTKHGIIQNWLERNSLAITKYNNLSVKDVPVNIEASIRELVRLGSVGTGQGYKRCSCKKDCKTARCKCFKNGFICNSACHFSKTCSNHD